MKNPFKTNAFQKDKGIENFNKFYTKGGWLTKYSLACGYIESLEVDSDNRLTLEKDGCYHVKGFIEGVHVWECFGTWTEARKFFIKQIRTIKNVHNK